MGFKKSLTGLIAVIMLFGQNIENVGATGFSDVSNTYRAKEEIDYLVSRGIVSGYKDGTFRPSQGVNRAETAVMIGKALGLNGSKRSTGFSDVSGLSFASGYIQSAVEKGIITGYGDGTYRPGKIVTRSEMAILLARAFKLTSTSSSLHFSDVYPSSAAYSSINKVATSGIATGYLDGTFRPVTATNRADFSAFLARSLNTEFRVDHNKRVIAEEIVNVNGLNVRTGPGTSYASKGKVNLGYRVSVYKYTGTWALINYKGLEGYVHQDYINPPMADLSKKIIVIDAGHGGTDSGAVGNGLLEKNINLDTTLRLEKHLKAAGVNVVTTRKTDVFIELQNRVKIAKDNKGEMFISIHVNSGGGHGTETYYYGSAGAPGTSHIQKSKKLSELIQKRMVSMLGTTNRGVKEGNFHVLRENGMTSTLVELGFIDNSSDAKKLGSAAWREKASQAIYLGILDFYKLY
ncbi:N-acetylmuramoyl-L-alanine amidase [Fictibacillus phosphorivorans]|uniref:N-acetylmuramoyl-L-alanine amidase n=1 Tax=Fictibacillus phosphorivorans TaxID=1221500 RepID=UPI0035E9333F